MVSRSHFGFGGGGHGREQGLDRRMLLARDGPGWVGALYWEGQAAGLGLSLQNTAGLGNGSPHRGGRSGPLPCPVSAVGGHFRSKQDAFFSPITHFKKNDFTLIWILLGDRLMLRLERC